MSRGGGGLGLFLMLTTSAACAGRVGGQATAGALQTVDRQVRTDAPEEERAVSIVAGRAVDGAMAHLASPEQIAALRRVVAAASAQAVASALATARAPLPDGRSRAERLADESAAALETALVTGLVGHLGPSGGGPLARSLSATAAGMGASATDGVLSRLAPGCASQDLPCLEARLIELGRSAATGVTAGVRDAVAPGALLLAFGAGFLGGAAAAALVGLLLARRRGRRNPLSGPALTGGRLEY